VSDVVRANLLAATSEAAAGEVINVASGKSATLLELVALLREAVGAKALGIDPEHQEARPGDLRASSADLAKARRMLGYEPRVALRDGLEQLVQALRGAGQRAA
jgi:nucleoside-diphosphate-sugar epimerase